MGETLAYWFINACSVWLLGWGCGSPATLAQALFDHGLYRHWHPLVPSGPRYFWGIPALGVLSLGVIVSRRCSEGPRRRLRVPAHAGQVGVSPRGQLAVGASSIPLRRPPWLRSQGRSRRCRRAYRLVIPEIAPGMAPVRAPRGPACPLARSPKLGPRRRRPAYPGRRRLLSTLVLAATLSFLPRW
jgi:hypothetical protein